MKSTSTKNKVKPRPKMRGKNSSFPVVAIGASAGGLEAITQLLQNISRNTGMAFVYVQHLSPDRKSMLTSLLSKLTLMNVQEVTNKVLMKPDNFYVIPPDKEMAVLDGHLELMPRRKGHAINLPIDTLFCSLAEKYKDGVIGIILSGSATDGTLGLSAIKDAGGLTFAQDDSAKFSSMPHSAIAAGATDFVLSPKEIGFELTRLSHHHRAMQRALSVENEIENSDPNLKIILNLLHKETGVDFSHYKMTPIKRRILRRIQLNKLKTLKEYAKMMSRKRDEISILYQDLLINVTRFFRDTDAHHYLKSTLLHKLLKSKAEGETLRIWIPACSTGEEAYSIAMSILEIQSEKSINTQVQIFATDLSAGIIAKARKGEYTKHELEPVSPKRLQRFSTKSGNHYVINKVVRDMCVFAVHNVLRDPPFSRVDFVSCCNLLIYLDSGAQKKIIGTFHYALNDGGYLMLGKSETIGTSGQLFTPVNAKFRIYLRKKNSVALTLPELLRRSKPISLPERNVSNKFLKTRPIQVNGLDSAIEAILLSHYMPPSVVINYGMEILQFRGAIDMFLSHRSGKASLNILGMAPSEITFDLRSAILTSIKAKQTVHKTGTEVKVGTSSRMIHITVIPLPVEWDEPLLLVLFTESEPVATLLAPGKGANGTPVALRNTKDQRIKKLEEQLLMARTDMRAFMQEQESFNAELQSANEEVVSNNEELQSVNEELETSREEIESTNEELMTANQELQTRNDLLHESYEYSEAIISTLHEPLIVLDKDLRVKSANKSFYNTFIVTKEDTEGTLLYDLGNKQWDISRLRERLESIIPKNTHFHDLEVTHTFPGIGKKIMLLNASRIVQKSHGVQLILLAIHDVTEVRMKTIELRLKEKELLNKDIKERKAEKAKLEKAVTERTKELEKVNNELAFQNEEKEKRAAELIVANRELEHQNTEKEKRAAELIIANKELSFQNLIKEKLAAELIIANKELAYQNAEKEKRAAELITANKELEGFSYISSHDMQEPLRKIQTFGLRILETENQNLSEKGKDYFKRMQKAASRMQQLIEDLLAFSHLNIAERKFETTDLNKIVTEVNTELKEIIEEKHGFIEAVNLAELNLIPFQFRQLMYNLISNSLKFSKLETPPHIIIKTRIGKGKELNPDESIREAGALRVANKLSDETKYCHISVSDNGIGFDTQYEDRIFEVFQRLHGKDEYAGTGIGLAIVKKIVENHNGIIKVTSQLNEGTTFNIYIPVP